MRFCAQLAGRPVRRVGMFPTYALHVHSLAVEAPTTGTTRKAPVRALELHMIASPCDNGSVAWLARGEGIVIRFLKVGRA